MDLLIAVAIFVVTITLVIWLPRGLGIGWSALLGAALIMTPIVMAMLMALRFSPTAMLAFVMAAGFIADTTSLPLVTSNLVNIVSADFFGLGFAEYAAVMMPLNLVLVAASVAVLLLFFRRDLPRDYDATQLAQPGTAIRDHATFRAGWWVLGLLLLAVTVRSRKIATGRVLRGAPWQIIIFSLGMYLVVYGLRNEGLTAQLAVLLDRFAAHGVFTAALGTGALSALLSSVMNNLPTVLIGALSIDATSATDAVREAMIYANVIGSDLGPKIAPIGSLATLLWLHVLAAKKLTITWGYYFRVGFVITIPVLLVTLLALAWRLN